MCTLNDKTDSLNGIILQKAYNEVNGTRSIAFSQPCAAFLTPPSSLMS